MCRPHVAKYLLELVFVVFFVQVVLCGDLGRDRIGNDAVELVAHIRVTHEDHVQQTPLVLGEQVVHDLRRVLVHVDEQPRQVVERNVVVLAVEDCVDEHTINDCAVHRKVHAKVFDLHNAYGRSGAEPSAAKRSKAA